MTLEELTPSALELPPAERVALTERLWESLLQEDEATSLGQDREAIAVAIQRDQEVKSGQDKTYLHDRLMQKLRG